MKRDNDRQTAIILSIVGIVPVIWLALLIAPSISGGLPEIAANLATLFDNPFSIKLCGDSLKTVLILLLCYGMGIGIYFSTRKNYRRREEHGTAASMLLLTLSAFEWEKDRKTLIYGQVDYMYGEALYKPEMKEGNPIRLYSLDEITEIFCKLGLRICNSFADFSGKPSSDNDIQLMVYSIRE